MKATDGWNFADVWEIIADLQPDELALFHGDRSYSWQQFDQLANGFAQSLVDHGLGQNDKVAQYLYNCPEYTVSVFGAMKVSMAPVNTNYRYLDKELLYLWDNSDASAIVFDSRFTEVVAKLRAQLPKVRVYYFVAFDDTACPEWAVEFATIQPQQLPPEVPWNRSGDDLYMLYTGGTTGMPKGVMWRQDDLYNVFSSTVMHDPEKVDHEAIGARILPMSKRFVSIPCCPLMHGTGAFTSFQTLCMGGSVGTLTEKSFSAEELLDTIQDRGVSTLAIVGDAFSRPILQALHARPGHWDISSLAMIVSSGVMWSEEIKRQLLDIHPAMFLLDAFSSSEALGMGQSLSGGAAASKTASFALGDRAIVVNEDLERVGPGEKGMVAIGGFNPVGYYKDPEKTAKTFLTIDSKRYCVPGDWAQIETDGSITLLGRGSVCINTGGEKVFPEEVEEVLKHHPGITDAACIGHPEPRLGQAIVAIVETTDQLQEDDVINHVKSELASYKAPKRVVFVDDLKRAVNGKMDYARWINHAKEIFGESLNL